MWSPWLKSIINVEEIAAIPLAKVSASSPPSIAQIFWATASELTEDIRE